MNGTSPFVRIFLIPRLMPWFFNKGVRILVLLSYERLIDVQTYYITYVLPLKIARFDGIDDTTSITL